MCWRYICAFHHPSLLNSFVNAIFSMNPLKTINVTCQHVSQNLKFLKSDHSCDEWSILLIDLHTQIFSSIDFSLCGAYAHTTSINMARDITIIYSSNSNGSIAQLFFLPPHLPHHTILDILTITIYTSYPVNLLA